MHACHLLSPVQSLGLPYCNVVAVTLATSEYKIQRIGLVDTLAKGVGLMKPLFLPDSLHLPCGALPCPAVPCQPACLT